MNLAILKLTRKFYHLQVLFNQLCYKILSYVVIYLTKKQNSKTQFTTFIDQHKFNKNKDFYKAKMEKKNKKVKEHQFSNVLLLKLFLQYF